MLSMILKPNWNTSFPLRKKLPVSERVPYSTFSQCNLGAYRFSDTKSSTITKVLPYFLVKNLSLEEFEL